MFFKYTDGYPQTVSFNLFLSEDTLPYLINDELFENFYWFKYLVLCFSIAYAVSKYESENCLFSSQKLYFSLDFSNDLGTCRYRLHEEFAVDDTDTRCQETCDNYGSPSCVGSTADGDCYCKKGYTRSGANGRCIRTTSAACRSKMPPTCCNSRFILLQFNCTKCVNFELHQKPALDDKTNNWANGHTMNLAAILVKTIKSLVISWFRWWCYGSHIVYAKKGIPDCQMDNA